jgi:DNA recombination protein RmuC
MANRCDFLEQSSTTGREGSVRPDMIVHLPGDRRVVVDAKVSLEAYLSALDAESEQLRDRYLAQHAQQILGHIHQLAQKGYWRHVEPSPEFVVMFIPGENFFASALTSNPKLLEIGAEKGVILATPTTLIALLKSVAVGWRQVATTENAQRISELGQLLYHRLGVMVGHMGRTGKHIDRCVTAFNAMVGSFESRVLVTARQLEHMGLTDGRMHKLETLAKIDQNPRSGMDAARRNDHRGKVRQEGE